MKLTRQPPRSIRFLAVLALVLGFFAVFARSPSRTIVSFDVSELARIIEREEDHISPSQLASLLMDSSAHTFRIIDVRDSASYNSYHIPGAEQFSLTSLVETGFLPRETLVIYSEGGIHASQAWFLLKARGIENVVTLRGGLSLWRDEILHPAIFPTTSKEERDSLENRARFFGGSVVPGREIRKDSAPSAHSHKPPVRFERERERPRDGC